MEQEWGKGRLRERVESRMTFLISVRWMLMSQTKEKEIWRKKWMNSIFDLFGLRV